MRFVNNNIGFSEFFFEQQEKRKQLIEYLRFLDKSRFNVFKVFKDARNTQEGIGPVRDKEGNLKYEDAEKVEIFNNHFQSVFTQPTSRTCNSETKAENAKVCVDDMVFTQEDVLRTLESNLVFRCV